MSGQSTTNNNSSSSSTSLPLGFEAPNPQDQQYAVGPPQDPRGGLYAPSLHGGNIPDTSLAAVVARLMNPPFPLRHADGTVTLTIIWAVGVVGPERFESRFENTRHLLSPGDELREHGVDAGLAPEILEWLANSSEEDLTLLVETFPNLCAW